MIFACGVCFIRLRSVLVSGCASRSARAARLIAAAFIGRGGLGVLPKVVVLLILRYVVTLRRRFRHKRRDESRRSTHECVRHEALRLQVGLGFGVVPLEFYFYATTGYQ